MPLPSFPSVPPSVKVLANNLNSKLFCGNTGIIENVEEELNDRTHESPDNTTEKTTHSPTQSGVEHTDGSSDQPHRTEHDQNHQLLLSSTFLENTGSVARDHLANERTWLAYIRTSITISGTGIALVQLFTVTALNDSEMVISAAGIDLVSFGNALPRIIRPLGCAIVLGGLGVLLIGIYRYFTVQNALQKGLFPTARCLVVLTSAVLIAFIAINFGLFVTIPNPR